MGAVGSQYHCNSEQTVTGEGSPPAHPGQMGLPSTSCATQGRTLLLTHSTIIDSIDWESAGI